MSMAGLEGQISPVSPTLLHGFGISGYGSLQSTIRLGPLAKLNFLVGRNNHGKSTILRASRFFSADVGTIPNVDRFLNPARARNPGPQAAPITREILSVFSPATFQDAFGQHVTNSWEQFAKLSVNRGLGLLDRRGNLHVWTPLVDQMGIAPVVTTNGVWAPALGQMWPPQIIAQGLLRAAGFSGDGFVPGPAWKLVPAFREVRAAVDVGDFAPDPESGMNLIQEIQRWQSPDSTTDSYDRDRNQFARLTDLLRDVLEDDTALPYVPFNARSIQCTTRYHRTPLDLDDLGDGIKQVLMIGAAALRNDHTLLCIEEPEIHLHPGMQRKLMAHLRDRTTNQYLIATHSAHMLDTAGAAIFHVTHNGVTTEVVAAIRVDDLVRVSDDLGYRASDLLQANYVIWVEGPADRIYWRRWIKLCDPSLDEGVHFSIMSFGGSLASDLDLSGGSALNSEQREQDLIDLMRLGRRCTVIVDSDRSSAEDEDRALVNRLRSEASATEHAEVLCIDSVRTVENLVPADVLTASTREVHSRNGTDYEAPVDPFAAPFATLDVKPAKVAIARLAVQDITALDEDSALTSEIAALVGRIRYANGFDASSP